MLLGSLITTPGRVVSMLANLKQLSSQTHSLGHPTCILSGSFSRSVVLKPLLKQILQHKLEVRWGVGDKVIIAGVTCAESEIPDFRTLLQEKTREGVRSPARESSCPKLQYCQPVPQEYRGVQQQRPKVPVG